MLLSIRDLKIYYHTQGNYLKAVDGVSLEIKEGEVVALVGESGSGKSTVALAIPKLLPRSAAIMGGQIIFQGKNILDLDNDELRHVRGKMVGIVFQEPVSYLNPLMKIGEQIAEALKTHSSNLMSEEAVSAAKSILKKVRVPDVDRTYDCYPHQLSGGMAQRVGIGIAISCEPSLLIADEPTSNLDLTVQAQILHLLKGLMRELNLAILFISHNLGVVSGMADRVVVMYAGRIAEEAPVQALFNNPLHPYSKLLLHASRVTRHGETSEVSGSLPDPTNPPEGCRFIARCPFARAQCRTDPPAAFPDLNSRVYCWLYGEKK